MSEFLCPDPITVAARLAAGSLELTAEPRDTAVVEVTAYDDTDASREAAEQTQVELNGDTLVIAVPEGSGWSLRRRQHAVRIVARVPAGSSGRLKAASAKVTCYGEWAELELKTASGNIDLAQVTGDLAVTTASGDLRAQRVAGHLTAHTASGQLLIQQVNGPVELKTASGEIQLDEAASDVEAKTASGRIRIGTARAGTVRAKTVSGAVSIGVAAGTGVWLDLNTLNGRTRTDLDMGQSGPATPELTVHVRTVSGSIEVRRVSLPAVGGQT